MNTTGKTSHSSVGIKLMDRDHDHLTEIVTEIQLRAAAGFANGQAGAMLRKLSERMRLHFALEEGLMSATRYPGTAIHCLKHRWLVDQVDLLAAQPGRNPLERNAQLFSLLLHAHSEHIGREDLDYGLWLNAIRPRATDTSAYVPRVEF